MGFLHSCKSGTQRSGFPANKAAKKQKQQLTTNQNQLLMKPNFFLSLLTGLFLICAPPLANAQEQGIIDIEPNEIRDKVQGEDYENIYRTCWRPFPDTSWYQGCKPPI